MGERREVCVWSYMDWPGSDSNFEGDCGIAWSMIEGGLEENGVRFCPRCGGAIDFVPPDDDEENDDDR